NGYGQQGGYGQQQAPWSQQTPQGDPWANHGGTEPPFYPPRDRDRTPRRPRARLDDTETGEPPCVSPLRSSSPPRPYRSRPSGPPSPTRCGRSPAVGP